MAITKGAIPLGKTCTLLDITNTSGAGSEIVYSSVESDSVLISAFAEVVSGTLDIQVFTLT